MSSEQQVDADGKVVLEEEAISLEDLMANVDSENKDNAKDLVEAFLKQAVGDNATIKFDRNIHKTIDEAVREIDRRMTEVLRVVMQHPKFSQLEGKWRGLNYLVQNSHTGPDLKIKVFNASKKEILKDFQNKGDFVRSVMYKKVHDSEYDTPNGQPYGCLIGDFQFDKTPEDIEFLRYMSKISAAAFAPFVTSPSPRLFGLGRDDFSSLMDPHTIGRSFESVEYASWNGFRQSEDSRFVTMALPRLMARMPYGAMTKPTERFRFQEAPMDRDGNHLKMNPDQFCWMNAAYALAQRMGASFKSFGLSNAIRGKNGGGTVKGLPNYTYKSEKGDVVQQCPTEIAITGRRDYELAELGFNPLSHYKDTDYAVFFGGQTTNKPVKTDNLEKNKNAEIAARLPYIMLASRFSHYIKSIARDMVGEFKEANDIRSQLQTWINQYVNASESAGPASRAAKPLKSAEIIVEETDRPGYYDCRIELLPWMQMEGLSTAIGFVAQVSRQG